MLSNLLDDLRCTSSQTEKKEILQEYDSSFLQFLLRHTYHPMIHHNVKIKEHDIEFFGRKEIEEMKKEVMLLLSKLQLSQSHKKNKEAVLDILHELLPDDQELLMAVINKGLKAGTGRHHVRSVWPGLIPHFKVQKAKKYEPGKDYGTNSFLWSYKMDGLRVVSLYTGKWHIYSGGGREFTSLEHLKPDLEHIRKKHGLTFLDGEGYLHKKGFEDIQGAITTKNGSNQMEYQAFVGGKSEDFLAASIGRTIPLDSTIDREYIKSTHKGEVVNKESHINKLLDKAIRQGYEGIMLRNPHQVYDYKRSDKLLKVKLFDFDECLVTEVEFDEFPVIEDGMHHLETLPVRLIVKQKDGLVGKVGSGFNLDFRRRIADDPDYIIGKTIDVKHQGYGSKGKMRFPVFKRIREDK